MDRASLKALRRAHRLSCAQSGHEGTAAPLWCQSEVTHWQQRMRQLMIACSDSPVPTWKRSGATVVTQ
jgi:hypothetical protein